MHEPNDITSLSPINGGTRLVEEMPLVRCRSGKAHLSLPPRVNSPASRSMFARCLVCVMKCSVFQTVPSHGIRDQAHGATTDARGPRNPGDPSPAPTVKQRTDDTSAFDVPLIPTTQAAGTARVYTEEQYLRTRYEEVEVSLRNGPTPFAGDCSSPHADE